MKNTKAAPFSKRVLALVVDGLLLLTLTTASISLFNAIVPNTQVEPMAMQLMPPKMLAVFFYTMLLTTAVISIYVFFAPHTKWGGTVGHNVAKIKMVTLKGNDVQWIDSVRRLWVTAFRAGLVFFSGPLLALANLGVIYSVLALLWGLILVLPIPVRRTTQTVTLWQLLGNYKFIERI